MAKLARSFFTSFFPERETFNPTEARAVKQLVHSHRELPDDTKSEDGVAACTSFLQDLAHAARILRVQPAPRSYRADFTPNYRAIFPDESFNYRADVLEGCLASPATIWVNGDQFDLSPETLCCADALRTAWTDLGAILNDSSLFDSPRAAASTPGRLALCVAMQTFDTAWASLEHKYITELIVIEGKARYLIVEAIACQKKLASLEAQTSTASMPLREACVEQAKAELVRSICLLNSVSNHRGKGRDDLKANILNAALKVKLLHHSASPERGVDRAPGALATAQLLATDVMRTYDSVRQYLIQVEQCLEGVDPHLCNNHGLVERLVHWEESWEIGQKYLTNEPLLNSLSDLVGAMTRLEVVEPKLRSMREDCDVEFFLVIPRLLLLRYLCSTDGHEALLQALLPHRFAPSLDPLCSKRHGPELAALQSHFEETRQAVMQSQPQDAEDSSAAAWEFFANAALGTRCDPPDAAIASFMRDLESWSVELQRHCAEDWNQCSAVLMQCLAGIPRLHPIDPASFDV